MDFKEVNGNQYHRKNHFDVDVRERARKQLEQEKVEQTKNNLRSKIKSLEDVHRRDRSGNKNMNNFQGNGKKFNNWGNERAINRVLKRKERQQINDQI
ncbi:unnamed protein product [Paramecium octaurelia]|uniref:Uncharacterized protein n=1 Tax=Paramecium octaurelia TaxID=43137 RepID=A0A8S1W5D1_PAROT|nr:unnamed protein product [Paramecium octaurelia]